MDRVIFCQWCNEAVEPGEETNPVMLKNGDMLAVVCLDCQGQLKDAGYLPHDDMDWMKDEVMV